MMKDYDEDYDGFFFAVAVAVVANDTTAFSWFFCWGEHFYFLDFFFLIFSFSFLHSTFL
jgi:hypothetical protein